MKPGLIFPTLNVHRLDGARWRRSRAFKASLTLIEFYRGYHCPRCKARLQELNALTPQLSAQGITCLAISMDDKVKANLTLEEWDVGNLDILWGLSIGEARELDLFISQRIRKTEPLFFSEPGTFLVQPNGAIYISARSSMPIMRPNLEDVIIAAQYLDKHNYPARGSA